MFFLILILAGTFDWSDGTRFNYQNWAPDNPRWQDCAELSSYDGRWYTQECDIEQGLYIFISFVLVKCVFICFSV